VWPVLQASIRRGLSAGAGDTLTEVQLFEGVQSGAMDMWVAHDGDDIKGAVILQIDRRAQGKVLFVVMSVGLPGQAIACTECFLPRLREYGEMIGAYTVESWSRPGAARVLARYGCKPKAMIMELNDGRQS
jgi:hypothetical protein